MTWYISAILYSLEILSVVLIREHASNPDARIYTQNPKDILRNSCSKTDSRIMAGTTVYWLILEVLVYFFFVFTMILFMIKSRFINMVKDPSLEFEEIKMRKMIERIIDSIEYKMPYGDLFYVGKERMIKNGTIFIKVNMTQEDFENIKNKVMVQDPADWVTRNVVGKVTKDELDDRRNSEMNTLDFI